MPTILNQGSNQQISRLYRYGKELNTHDLIKIIAILLMVIDHIGEFLLNDNLTCRLLGRGAAPLFFFLIGYVNKLRITPSLVLYGLALSFTGFFLETHFWISILITFIVIDILLKLYPIERASTLARSILFLTASIATIFCYDYVEYGLLGLMIAYAGRLIALKDKQASVWLAISFLYYYFIESVYFRFTLHLSHLLVFGAMMLCGYFALRVYQLRKVACPRFCLWPALCLSRYSLEIYFYHLILLQGYFFIQHYHF